jgi:hypothetical protein
LRLRPGAFPRIRKYRAHGACEIWDEEEAMSMHIVETSNAGIARNPHAPFGFRRGHLRHWRSSTMYTDIACVALTCICPRGARNATFPNSRTGSKTKGEADVLANVSGKSESEISKSKKRPDLTAPGLCEIPHLVYAILPLFFRVSATSFMFIFSRVSLVG